MNEIFSDVSQVGWIRVGALGDLLVALAALEETQNKFPKAKVYVFGPKLWLQILKPKLWPKINGIIVVQDDGRGVLHIPNSGADEKEGWKAQGVATPLRYFFKKCQATVNHRVESYRYAWGPFFAGVRYRFGTCPVSMKWLYTHWSPWIGKDPIIHERDRHLRILEAPRTKLFQRSSTQHNRDILKQEQTGEYGVKPNKYLVFHPKQNQSSLAFKWRARALPAIINPREEVLCEYGLEPKKYWAVNPTSSRWEKAWSKEKFREFCERLEAETKTEVRADAKVGAGIKTQALSEHSFSREIIILGAPNETEWLQFVSNKKFRVIQPKNIDDLANIIAFSELLITNTSSVQFIAATTKTPSLVLMGRTFPARWGPLGAQDHFVAGRVPENFQGNIFEEDYAGYDSICVDELVSKFKNWLNTF